MIDAAELAAVLERLDPQRKPDGEQVVASIGIRSAGTSTAALTRVQGRWADGGSWSLVLKEIHHGTGHPFWSSSEALADPTYWRREAHAFTSGMLPASPDGLRAPGCYGVFDRPDSSVGLWVEDVTAGAATAWPLERYALAARHLGVWHGSFMTGARSLPDEAWLARGWMRDYVERHRPNLDTAELGWDDPLIRDSIPPELGAVFERIFDDRELFLDAIDRAPRTLNHNDCWARNLFGDPDDGTILIDWGCLGIGAAGEDVATLAPVAVLDFFVPPDQSACILDEVWAAYLAGLRDAGWNQDPTPVRLAFAATAGLKFYWLVPHLLTLRERGSLPEMERATGFSALEMFQARASMLSRLAQLADEARDLIKAGV